MIVFIGMETSGEMRRRWQAKGFETYSGDVLPAEDHGEGHIVGDVFETLEGLWAKGLWPSLAIFHPTCTFLTGAAAWAFKDGPYHQKVKPGTLVGRERRAARRKALDDVRRLMALPIERKVIENPVGAISNAIRKPSQIVQPYQFGDDASKKTCFWYIDKDGNDLPDMRIPIDPAKRAPGRTVNGREYWSNQTDTGQNRLSPGDERWKDRSRTFPGLAQAAVDHWSNLISWI